MDTLQGERTLMRNVSGETVEFDELRCPECRCAAADEALLKPSEELVSLAAKERVGLAPPATVYLCQECGHESDRWVRIVSAEATIDVPPEMVETLGEMGLVIEPEED